MKFTSCVTAAAAVCSFVGGVSAITIAQINGPKFLSPYAGKDVAGVRGLVTGTAATGIFMRSTAPDNRIATSESIFVFSRSISGTVSKGDIVTLDGTVSEYRADDTYLYLTEIINPTNINVVSSGNTVSPVIIGQQTNLIGNRPVTPPTEEYTNLDNAGVFSVPNNQTQVSKVNPTLHPNKYGLDFWESLSGEFVTVRSATVLDVPNQYGDTWIIGDYTVTGQNNRGGLTITVGDGNPEAILVQTPLDGSDNPTDSKLGDALGDVTGVITYAFGSYTIRPETHISVIASRTPATPPATTLMQNGGCMGLTVSDYNVENFMPDDQRGPKLANQIVNFLNNPTILFIQEIQDNSGDTDDGTTNANMTLQSLVEDIVSAGGKRYAYTDVSPVDGTTGGEPGGNIRNAYLYNPNVVKLVNPNPGGPNQGAGLKTVNGKPALVYNPGLIAPNNAAFNDSRRPLVAQWSFLGGKNEFFTVNTHATSKGGSSSLFGDLRPPVNLGVDQRDAEANVTANFIRRILQADSTAKIIASGDWNEFRFVKPQTDFVAISGLEDVDDVVNTDPDNRYSYLFGQNSQALIHLYVSPSIADNNMQLQRIHVNTWATYDSRASDHDPDVIMANVCESS